MEVEVRSGAGIVRDLFIRLWSVYLYKDRPPPNKRRHRKKYARMVLKVSNYNSWTS